MSCKLCDVEAVSCLDHYIRILARDIERRASAHGLAASEWFVLEELERHASISLRELARASAVSVPAASRAITRLVAAGLADMRRMSDNKRLSAISITDAGVRFLEKARGREEGASSYREVMTADDLHVLGRSLGALATNVQKFSRPVS
ncbi:MarR family winged helix-turn-helix transcriptional regulator [Luteimonas saliphila]|uniref:MarR family winged helix-turn-helix transcriptional regulator n=1 Tax=Luteimonas saliphila TaxID=2804919 RepID=UPI00192D55C3|nr:MarR family transcriptional regulator [Luteimonas saliphila]